MLQNLKELHDKNNLPNLLLYGNNLIGKKTLLEQLLLYIYKNYKNIENNTLILNCSLGKGNIKFIRDNLRFFANTIIHKNITNFKSIVLLNADSLTLDAQSALRRSIEIYSNTKFFIVTANKSKIIKPILSRFCEIFCNINNMNFIYKSLTLNNNSNNSNNSNNKCNSKLALIIKKLNNAMKDLDDYSKNNLLINYSSLIYNKGISANGLLEYFTNCSNFKSELSKFIFFFDIYKKEIRSEEFLIFIILYFYNNKCIINFSIFNNI
jgi:DNA polymerase III delta prime subunit